MSDEPAAFPLFCTLPETIRPQRRQELQTLLQQHHSSRLLEDGIALSFQSTTTIIYDLTEFILYERLCCSAFTYELVFPPPHAQVQLRLRAPADQVQALQQMYQALAAS